ncbi:hypothetical protein IG631_03746 [Alternaria alternata]|nr:hypothetical protein IG631_03746 [Alternaria alternata]
MTGSRSSRHALLSCLERSAVISLVSTSATYPVPTAHREQPRGPAATSPLIPTFSPKLLSPAHTRARDEPDDNSHSGHLTTAISCCQAPEIRTRRGLRFARRRHSSLSGHCARPTTSLPSPPPSSCAHTLRLAA